MSTSPKPPQHPQDPKDGSAAVVILDGPMGTELARRGFELRGPLWSIRANREAPQLVRSIYLDYLKAGAQELGLNTLGISSGLSLDRDRDRRELDHRIQAALACLPQPQKSPKQREVPLAASLSLAPQTRESAAFRLLEEIDAVLGAGISKIRLETILDPQVILDHWPQIAERCRATLPSHRAGAKTFNRGQIEWTLASPAVDPAVWIRSLADRGALSEHSPLSGIGYNCIALSQAESLTNALCKHLAGISDIPVLELSLRPHCSQRSETGEWNTHAVSAPALLQSLESWLPSRLRFFTPRLRLGVCCGGGPEHVARLQQRFNPAPIRA